MAAAATQPTSDSTAQTNSRDKTSRDKTDASCPNCRYRLLGLDRPRCPECGHEFDWAQLASYAADLEDRVSAARWLIVLSLMPVSVGVLTAGSIAGVAWTGLAGGQQGSKLLAAGTAAFIGCLAAGVVIIIAARRVRHSMRWAMVVNPFITSAAVAAISAASLIGAFKIL